MPVFMVPGSAGGTTTKQVGYFACDHRRFAEWLVPGLGRDWHAAPQPWQSLDDALRDLAPPPAHGLPRPPHQPHQQQHRPHQQHPTSTGNGPTGSGSTGSGEQAWLTGNGMAVPTRDGDTLTPTTTSPHHQVAPDLTKGRYLINIDNAQAPGSYDFALRSLPGKYPRGQLIADVPKNQADRPDLVGQRLDGEYILEVPVQNAPIPQRILDLAEELEITIRDVNGKEY